MLLSYHDSIHLLVIHIYDSFSRQYFTDCITAAPRQLKYSIKTVVNMDYNKIADVLC